MQLCVGLERRKLPAPPHPTELKIFSGQFFGVSQCMVQIIAMALNDGSPHPDRPAGPPGGGSVLGCSHDEVIGWKVIASVE